MLAWLIPHIALCFPQDSLPLASTELNIHRSQYFPQYHVDSQNLYMTIRKAEKSDEDIVVAHWNGQHFDTPTPIESINGDNNEGTPSITQDGKTLYFSACDYPKSFGGCDLYESQRINETWTKPKNLGFLINSHEWEGQPHISPDGKKLYFSSDRLGGFGKRDIWVSEKDDQNRWATPQNLGKQINSKEDEQGPFVLADKAIFLFSSSKNGGKGGLDYYQTRYPIEANESTQPLDALNTAQHDAGFSLGITPSSYFISRKSTEKSQDFEVLRVWLADSTWLAKKVQRIYFDSLRFETIQFATNAWNLTDPVPDCLIQLVQYLRENATQSIEIQGHTDDVGNEVSNQILSEKRALAIKMYLLKSNIAADRIQTRGFGNTAPKEKLNRQVNRRIEIRLL
jgi:outer membrane protein OmpA-like peptidoglycan-associated protein